MDEILLTGSTGFIGSALVDGLSGGKWLIRAGTRSLSNRSLIGRPRVAPVACDLGKPHEIADAVAGVRLVIHTAYGSQRCMEAELKSLLQAMRDACVPALIYFSSISVYGDLAGPIDEASGFVGGGGTYGASKRDCEARIEGWVQESGCGRRAIILRPGAVYGTGSRFWTDKLAERIRLGLWGSLGPRGEGIAPLIHISDLVAMTVRATETLFSNPRTLPNLAVMNAVGPETPTWNDYFAMVAERMSLSPLPALDAAAIAKRRMVSYPFRILRRLGVSVGYRQSLAPTLGELRLFSRKASYSMHRAEQLLGFRPEVGLSAGLLKTSFGSDGHDTLLGRPGRLSQPR